MEITSFVPTDWTKGKNLIKVIGVGGGGGNAVNKMYNMGITGVDFAICNTDAQVLNQSPIPEKIQLGENITQGLGAGLDPEKGRRAALESAEEIKSSLANGTDLLFITAGMGGGTGTGAAPVIATIAKEMGILTVAVVTFPFRYEGRGFLARANDGIETLYNVVDSILIIDNEKISIEFGDLTVIEGFEKADSVLSTAVKGIAEIITLPSHVNVDLADLRKVMENSGVTLMGTGRAEGPQRASEAIKKAIESPLLSDFDLSSAENVIINFFSGNEDGITSSEMTEAMQHLQSYTGTLNGEFKRGLTYDESLGSSISITIVATGFDMATLPKVTLPEEEGSVHVIGPNTERSGVTNRNLHIDQQQVIEAIIPKKDMIERGSGISLPKEVTEKEVPALIIEENEKISNYEELPAYIRRGTKIGEGTREESGRKIQHNLDETE